MNRVDRGGAVNVVGGVPGARLMGADRDGDMVTEYWIHNDGKLTVRRLQDIEPHLIQNRAEFNSKSSKGRLNISEGLGEKVASIPMGAVEHFMSKGLNLYKCPAEDLKKIINDSNYSKFRTARGRI